MSKVILQADYLLQIENLDHEIRLLNEQKIRVLFAALGIQTTASDFAKMTDWELIDLSVPDKQMAVQLNKLCAYVPNLRFIVDTTPLFTISQGAKKRRVWKDR